MRLEVVVVKFFSWGVQAGLGAMDFSARDPGDKSYCNLMPAKPVVILITLILASASLPFRSFADTVKDREGAIRKDRATLENDARWIYNDSKRGFAEARRTGKPVLAVLRCVPCLA